ncbi:hypothetical protein HDV01_000179 [Terramyces sp. JEL0728]|nr:hypothetical protein HDV01_000179 [Terramyces sp. JEL0728]
MTIPVLQAIGITTVCVAVVLTVGFVLIDEHFQRQHQHQYSERKNEYKEHKQEYKEKDDIFEGLRHRKKPFVPDSSLMSQFSEMGFAHGSVVRALRDTNNNREEALEKLLQETAVEPQEEAPLIDLTPVVKPPSVASERPIELSVSSPKSILKASSVVSDRETNVETVNASMENTELTWISTEREAIQKRLSLLEEYERSTQLLADADNIMNNDYKKQLLSTHESLKLALSESGSSGLSSYCNPEADLEIHQQHDQQMLFNNETELDLYQSVYPPVEQEEVQMDSLSVVDLKSSKTTSEWDMASVHTDA